MKRRLISKNEVDLITCLLKEVNYDVDNLNSFNVIEMEDGGMGSVYLLKENEELFIRSSMKLVEKQFSDADGIPISVRLNVDENNLLYELDIWKVNFEPLINYPRC